MKRCFVVFAIAATTRFASLHAQELPTKEGEQPLEQPIDVEPPLLIQSRNADGSLVLAGPAAAAVPDADIEKLERNLARAKRNASGADRLYKAGIISKVEAEERELRVVRLQATLAEAQLQIAKRQPEAEATEEAQPEGNATVEQAEQTAARAAEERRKAEIDAAFRNLQRQQKLLALGSGRKADVNRAEQKLAELQRAGE
jgi:hypothetical protein